MRFGFWLILICALVLGCSESNESQQRPLTLGVSTTIQDSGLLKTLSPALLQKHPDLRILVSPSGQLHRLSRDGEVDVIISHHPKGEQSLLDEGVAKQKQPLMKNRFLLVGPKEDPAHVATSLTFDEAFKKIAQRQASFVSRADGSGTHQFEHNIWQKSNITDYPQKVNTGTGMADSLRVALARESYILIDQATWQALADETEGFEILLDDEEAPDNVYSLLLIDDKGQALFDELANNTRNTIEQFYVNNLKVFMPYEP